MDVKEKLEHALSLWQFLFKVGSDQLNLSQPNLKSFWIVISKEVSIHILALCVASIVARNDTIWIDDGGDPKLVHVPQLVADYLSRKEEIQETMDDE